MRFIESAEVVLSQIQSDSEGAVLYFHTLCRYPLQQRTVAQASPSQVAKGEYLVDAAASCVADRLTALSAVLLVDFKKCLDCRRVRPLTPAVAKKRDT